MIYDDECDLHPKSDHRIIIPDQDFFFFFLKDPPPPNSSPLPQPAPLPIGGRPRREKKPADVAAEGEAAPAPHQEPADGALRELAPRRQADRELARQERGDETPQEDATIEERPRVEPRDQEIGAAHDPETRQHPVAPVAHAVRRGPRPVEREEEDVDRGDENGRPPDGPGAAEEHRVLLRERAAHQQGVTSSAARRTGRRPPTPPAPR